MPSINFNLTSCSPAWRSSFVAFKSEPERRERKCDGGESLCPAGSPGSVRIVQQLQRSLLSVGEFTAHPPHAGFKETTIGYSLRPRLNFFHLTFTAVLEKLSLAPFYSITASQWQCLASNPSHQILNCVGSRRPLWLVKTRARLYRDYSRKSDAFPHKGFLFQKRRPSSTAGTDIHGHSSLKPKERYTSCLLGEAKT